MLTFLTQVVLPLRMTPSHSKIEQPKRGGTWVRKQIPQPVSCPNNSERRLSARKREVHRYLGVNLNRFSVQNVRPIAPLLYGIKRRLGQQRVTAEDVQILNGAVFSNHGSQYNATLNPGRAGEWRILGLHTMQNHSLRHALRNAHPLNRNLGNRHRSAADNSADYAACGTPRYATRNSAHNT